ncbi:MAG: DUF1573 domain-containing protein [Thermodesulfobacteriota bacterium]
MTKTRVGRLPAKVWSLTWILAGVMGLAGVILAYGPAAGAAPRVVAPQTTYDFGKGFEDRVLSHTFILKNEGDAPLRVEDVDPDCACTVAEYDRDIPPGGEGRIILTIKPYSVMRNFLKNTTIKLNDPSRPQLVLTMKGYVQPIIEIQPSHIIRLRGLVSDDLRGQVRFISHLSQPWEITKYINGLQGMVQVEVKAEKPGKVYLLEVKNIRKEAGHYGGKIELFTSSRERPRLLVRVFANLYSDTSGPGGP